MTGVLSRPHRLAPIAALVGFAGLAFSLGLASANPRWLALTLALIAGSAFALAVLAWPRALAPAFPFLLYSRIPDLVGSAIGPISLFQLMIGLFGLAMLLDRLRRRESLVGGPIAFWAIAYAGVILLSGLLAGAQGSALTAFDNLLRDLAVALILVQLIAAPDVFRRSIWAVVAAATLLSTLALVGLATGMSIGGFAGASANYLAAGQFGSRLTGPVADPNDFARILAVAVPFAIALALNSSGRLARAAALTAALVISFSIAFTYSRAGILALAVILLLFIVRGRIRLLHVAAGILALSVLLLVSPSRQLDRVVATVQFIAGVRTDLVSGDESLGERTELMQVGLLMARANPLLGVGPGNYLARYRDYAWEVSPALRTDPLAPHSLPILLAAETGLAGLIVFAIVVGLAIHAARRAVHLAPDSPLALLAEATEIAIWGYLAASLFLGDSSPRYFWLLIGVAVAARAIAGRPVETRS